MKRILFIIFTVVSITSYIFSGFLLGMHFTDEKPGMTMIFLVPLLVVGLVSGIIAFFIKKTKHLEFKRFSIWLHYLNLVLIILGILALIYVFTNN